MTDLSLRPVAPDELPAVAELLRISLAKGEAPRSAEYMRWKHLESPFGPSPMWVATANDALVGLRAFQSWSWESGHATLRAVRPVDTATHPEWRRRGIFKRLTLGMLEASRETYDFVYNTPNEQSRPGYLKMGWVDVAKLGLWWRPLRALRLASRLEQVRRGYASPVVPPLADDGSVARLVALPGLDTFLGALHANEQRLHTPRSRAYLTWRYLDIPGFQYQARYRVRGIEGAIVVYRRRARRGLDETSIVEVLVGAGRRSEEDARALLRAIARESESDHLMAAAAPRSAELDVLDASWFLPTPPAIGIRLTARAFADKHVVPPPAQAASWRLQLGDLEVF